MSNPLQRHCKVGKMSAGTSGGLPTENGSSLGMERERSSELKHEKKFGNVETGTVMDMVTMLSCSDPNNAQRILLAMTGSAESCQALRNAGCIPLLIQILHPINVPPEAHPTQETKLRAAQTLKNVVQFNCDEKMKRREIRVLKLLESLRSYIDDLKNRLNSVNSPTIPLEKHPIASSTTLTKLSFDEDHRNAMCLLGAIHTLADLIQTDHSAHGINDNLDCIIMRRYSGMTLTNLTVGDKRNKLLLGTMKDFMSALVAQLDSPSDDVCQVAASVLRNLSWHASSALMLSLINSNATRKLMITAINAKKESTLRPALSALWNLSAHSDGNKIAICQTPNAIEFLVSLLESETLTIVENTGGILTNISIVVSTDDATRETFRSCGILEILLDHLQSSSILVVGNACGILWHLSCCEANQEKLMQLGAVRKLKVLTGSKHQRIKQGACSTLRNIMSLAEVSNTPKSVIPSSPTKKKPLSLPIDQQQPMDLRIVTQMPTTATNGKSSDLEFPHDEPLDLSFHSSKSTPVHTVSANEFGPRIKTIPFLNPPLQSKNAASYGPPKNYNSCPEFVHFVQAPQNSTPIDFTQEPAVTEDATINYSLYFPEPEDPVHIKNEDTVKTYYCEGTPLNFSTSNSMTDLTQVERPPKLKPIIETETADDLPRKYYTESTPATFSRASSLSSIASNVQGGENKAEYFEESLPKIISEKGKRNVTFSAADTPLIFSRTSSVNSLDSIDINYEETGSVASDFSRRVSEAVSPSELPDSPRQIPPPQQLPFYIPDSSIGRELNEEDVDTVRNFATNEDSCTVSGAQSARNLSPLTIDDGDEDMKIGMETVKMNDGKPPDLRKEGMEDEMKVFGVEGTPWLGVSTATSLSDLVCEMEKAEIEAVLSEKSPSELPVTPPPPLPPKKVKAEPAELVYVGTTLPQTSPSQEVMENTDKESDIPEIPLRSRLPKSKSELSKLNTKAIKMSTSYHENLKRENQLDPDLAALIMKGKSRVRGSKPSAPKNPSNGKLAAEDTNQKLRNGMSTEVEKSIEESPKLSISMNLGNESKEQVKSSDSKVNQSTTSMASEWNEDTLSLSVPSLSISTAFKLVQSHSTKEQKSKSNDGPSAPGDNMEGKALLLQSTESKIDPQTDGSSETGFGCGKSKFTTANESNLFNQKPPPEFDLDSSMISVASLRTEIASIAPLEEGMRDLSIGGDTYIIGGGGSDLTDAEDSFFDDTDSLDARLNSTSSYQDKVEQNQNEQNGDSSGIKGTPPMNEERFKTFTTKKHSSPRQKRRDDPGRYLTRTISPHTPRDTNGNHSPGPGNFSTFKVDRAPRIVKPCISATSNESSPSTSPKGIRGRRKQLYSSLPPQKRHGPPVPPTPVNGAAVMVRPTRTSELRAASSRDSSPKTSSRNSSSTSLNNSVPPVGTSGQHPHRKTPPKPPVRSSTSTSSKNFAVVRTVRNSNSSIGFRNDQVAEIGSDPAYNTLPRSLKPLDVHPKEVTKVQKLSNFWNHLLKPKSDNSPKLMSPEQQSKLNVGTGPELNNGNPQRGNEKKPKFGFNFGRKKKSSIVESTWISSPLETHVHVSDTNELSKEGLINLNKQLQAQNDASSSPPTPSGSTFASSKMTPV